MRRLDYKWSLEQFLRNFTFKQVNITVDYLILGDSIIKQVGSINNTQCISYPGINIARLAVLLDNNKIPEVAERKIIALHVGTNDATRDTPEQMLADMETLIASVRRINPTCVICVSHIIPRLLDFDQTNQTIKKFNEAVTAQCQPWDIKTIPTYNTFQSYARPIPEMYCSDKLHPSLLGDERLRAFLSNHMSKIRRSLGYPRKQDPCPKTIIRRSHSSVLRRRTRAWRARRNQRISNIG